MILNKRLSDDIFKQYDIRGKVGSELFIDEVYNLVCAIAYFFKKNNPAIARIVVGADGRIHSPAILEQVCQALQDSGLDVIFIGICPTPVLYFALYTLSVDGGLMITASHNTQEYNGLKIMLSKKAVWGQEISIIRDNYKERKRLSQKRGTYSENFLIEAYINWLAEHFSHLQNMQLAAIIDCGNGAAGTVLPILCKVMQWNKVKLLYPEVDGTYPNHTADPAAEENMRDLQYYLLKTTDYQVGIGLDGDCDRMGAVTKEGKIILGDKLLAVFADDIRQNIENPIIVYDLKCSSGLAELFQKWDIEFHPSPTGSAWVKHYMEKYNALLGGELSCHFFFHDRYFGFDDGIYAMMRLFEILIKTGKSLDELISIFPHKISSYEIRFEYPQGQRDAIMQYIEDYFKKKDVQVKTLDGVHITFKNGWGIIRASNTQAVLSIRFEADTMQDYQKIKNEFIASLQPFYEYNFLQAKLI